MNINVYYNDKICGNINVYDQDYMVVFQADCDIYSYDITRLFLKNNTQEIPLGILVPKDNRYVLCKKIPISHMKKYNLSEFSAFLKCESDSNTSQNFIIKETIKDKNLAKMTTEKIVKSTFENFDEYTFEYKKSNLFFFDFCIFACKVEKNGEKFYIKIKTDKKGEILV